MNDVQLIIQEFKNKQTELGVSEGEFTKSVVMIMTAVLELTARDIEKLGSPEALEKLRTLQEKMKEKGGFVKEISDEEGNMPINTEGVTIRQLFVRNLRDFIEKLG